MMKSTKIQSAGSHSLAAAGIALALLGLTGCDMITEKLSEKAAEKALEMASGAEDVDIDTETGKTTIKTKDGTVETNQEGEGTVSIKNADGSTMNMGGKLPEDFPLTLVEAKQVIQSMDSKDGKKQIRVVSLIAKTKDIKELDKLYTAELEKVTSEVARNEITQGELQLVTMHAKNKEKEIEASVQLSYNPEMEGVSVTLTHQSPQK